jgi:hypothetical protein
MFAQVGAGIFLVIKWFLGDGGFKYKVHRTINGRVKK